MKKIFLVYSIILLGVYILFSVLDWQSDYIVERKLWPINKQYQSILKDPNVVPEQTYLSVIDQYNKMINRYPKSRLMARVHLIISELYILKKDFNNARAELKKIVQKFPQYKALNAEALGRIGKTFENENNWEEALKFYKNVIKSYPITNMGVGLPIYIAQYYRNKNDYQQTMGAYEEAVNHYKKLALENPDTNIELVAKRFLVNCYIDQNRWQEAVDLLTDTLIKFSNSKYLTNGVASNLVMTIYAIGVLKMKDHDAAINAYQKFISNRPKHPFSNNLQKIIEGLRLLKSKSIESQPVE